MSPTWVQKVEALEKYLDWFWNRATEDEREVHRKYIATLCARGSDDPGSFAAFYQLVFGVQPPKHAMEEWIKPMYQAREEGKGVVIEAFRGSTKTTTLTIAFTAYRIGKEPHRANLLIQVGDDTATDTTMQIADIIENNPGFRRVFPNVVPDRERGWGAGGYEVKRADMKYTEWRDLNASRRDPTLLGVSYKSRTIIGRHPDGVLVVDDIHDENNTSSERELANVHRILTGTIFPTLTPDTWKVFVGTPWVENDALHYVSSTGEFVHLKTPVLRGEEYAWPEKFDEAEVERQQNLAGPIEFARMFLLDLTASKNKTFKYTSFPNSNVRMTWPIVAGVDYAGTRSNLTQKKTGDRDYFAIAYVAKLPGGGAVVVDGVLEKCSQAEAESYVMRGQNMYPNYLNAIVESDGKGEDFIQVLMRTPSMKVVPMHTKNRGKEQRLVKQMSPWLESGMVRISDAESPFLQELRKELDLYPMCKYDDALDALYYALRGMPDVLVMPKDEEELPIYGPREKKVSPFATLDNWA
jgi:predicted phage terminase large subunit-like protein